MSQKTTTSGKKKRLTGYLKWQSELPHRKNSTLLSSAIDDLTSRLGYRETINAQMAIIVWEEVVGEKIVKVTSPVSIKKGILKVKVKNPTWRNELSYCKEEIRRKLNKAVGEPVVADIRFE